MCEFCDVDNKPLYDSFDRLSRKGDFRPGARVEIDGNNLSIEVIADTYEPNYFGTYIPARYCLWCGRRLKED